MRREVLVGLDCLLAVRGPTEILEAIRAGQAGQGMAPRYGLLHAGDNNVLVDRVDIVTESLACRWYAALRPHEPPRRGTCRLTIGIDRGDSSRTTSAIYAPLPTAVGGPPSDAWTWVPRPPV